MPLRLVRTVLLDITILRRSVGLGLPVLAVLLCAGAGVQEPAFFRTQGHDLTWPFIYATADILCLVVLVAGPSISPASLPLRLCRVAASLIVAAAATGLCWGAGVLLDWSMGADTPWHSIARAVPRWLQFWLPMGLLAQSAFPARSSGLRLLLLGPAFLVQSALHPASLDTTVTVDTLLASSLATIGGLITMLRTHP